MMPGYRADLRFDIWECEGCFCQFADPRPDASAIYELIYRDPDVVPGYSRYAQMTRIAAHTKNPMKELALLEESYWATKKALDELAARTKQPPTIVEMGCGQGYLTYSMVRSGYNARGVDISQAAINEATQRFGDHFVCADIQEYAGKYGAVDALVANQLIEHVSEPVELVRAAITAVKAGGFALFCTPNRSSYPAEAVWQTELPPVHHWWFSEESMRSIAKQVGATVQFVDFTEFLDAYFTPAVDPASVTKTTDPVFLANGQLARHHPASLGTRVANYLRDRSGLMRRFDLWRYARGGAPRRTGSRGYSLCAMFYKAVA